MAKVTKKPKYQILNGIRIPTVFSPRHFNEALNYKPKPDDIFIVTYPKCGTTWMQAIALYIFRKGRELDQQDFLKLCPFIDVMGIESISTMPRPGALKTHLPYSHMPYSAEAKYIFVARNPKDCCVSLYYHTKSKPNFEFWDAGFDDFFELFMTGDVIYNDYFDHLMSWYPHRNEPNIFYTKYEDMKENTEDVVIKVAKFLGKEYINAIEKDNLILENILKFSSFEYMKSHVPVLIKNLPSTQEVPKWEFARKGIVGDWKNHFSEDQSNKLNQKFSDRTNGTEIQQWFSLE